MRRLRNVKLTTTFVWKTCLLPKLGLTSSRPNLTEADSYNLKRGLAATRSLQSTSCWGKGLTMLFMRRAAKNSPIPGRNRDESKILWFKIAFLMSVTVPPMLTDTGLDPAHCMVVALLPA